MRNQHIFTTIDSHVGGQSLRLITFGVPRLRPAPLRDQVAQLRHEFDDIRTWLLSAPRGRTGMTGALLVPSYDPEVDYGVIFMSSGGYKPMSGHGMIALATTLIESGSVPARGPEMRINFETLAGHIQARATVDNGWVRGVRFRNVPGFRLAKQLQIPYRDRTVTVDIAYGGNWYAIVRADDLGLVLEFDNELDIKAAGLEISRAAANVIEMVHPLDSSLSGIFGTVILGDSDSEDVTHRVATVYLDGLIDRSPCGTGMSATMACMAEDGDLQIGQPYLCESINRFTMSGRITGTQEVAGKAAIVTEIAGRGQIIGVQQFFVDEGDPFGQGVVRA
ncbi:MAG: proline racemase family protein [Thermomicrobiales bacterium]|nr:proline racemase family protein [Thermomicrobiales bacterium]MCO5227056.1 proline racemase family protein [Thermomicrobiales bacterium]